MRVPGKGKGRWRVGKNLDAALPDDLLEGFEGGR